MLGELVVFYLVAQPAGPSLQDYVPFAVAIAGLFGGYAAYRKGKPERESISVKTAMELVEGVRKEIGEARERIAVLEKAEREHQEKEGAMRVLISKQARELRLLRALIAGRDLTRHDDQGDWLGDRDPADGPNPADDDEAVG